MHFVNDVSFCHIQDKMLSKKEILDHQDLFVGRRATNYGDYIKHDEFWTLNLGIHH